mmetsp:Transcript_14743/g.28365  ORF Transcript_14743/g.28365 Transcript_14743/m.28365 type:complete len:243 (-) Transcript_14743:968-1696(-)
MTEGAVIPRNLVLVHSSAHVRRSENIRVRVVDAHHHRRTVHARVGNTDPRFGAFVLCLHTESQVSHDTVVHHPHVQLVVHHAPQQVRLRVERVLEAVVRLTHKRGEVGVFARLRARRDGRVWGDELRRVGACWVVVPVGVDPVAVNLVALRSALQVEVLFVANLGVRLLSVVHASHPAKHLVLAALQLLSLLQLAGAPHSSAHTAAGRNLLYHDFTHLAKGDTVLLMDGVVGRKEHATIPCS